MIKEPLAMKTKTQGKGAVWQLQEAKAMFSEVIKLSVQEPQFITVRGEKKAVILSIEDYHKTLPKQTLYEFMQSSPLKDMELELPQRLPEAIREINW
jgi:prevent-host-death family protein